MHAVKNKLLWLSLASLFTSSCTQIHPHINSAKSIVVPEICQQIKNQMLDIKGVVKGNPDLVVVSKAEAEGVLIDLHYCNDYLLKIKE